MFEYLFHCQQHITINWLRIKIYWYSTISVAVLIFPFLHQILDCSTGRIKLIHTCSIVLMKCTIKTDHVSHTETLLIWDLASIKPRNKPNQEYKFLFLISYLFSWIIKQDQYMMIFLLIHGYNISSIVCIPFGTTCTFEAENSPLHTCGMWDSVQEITLSSNCINYSITFTFLRISKLYTLPPAAIDST